VFARIGGDGSLAWCGVAAGDVGDVTVTHGLLSAPAAGTGRSHALDSSTSSPQPYTHRTAEALVPVVQSI